MNFNKETEEYFKKNRAQADFWMNKNRYYHEYVKLFVKFLVPVGKTSFELTAESPNISTIKHSYDYVILSDILGYVSDIQNVLTETGRIVLPNGRVVITQYNPLWQPILSLASKLGLRRPEISQNWVSLLDLKNFAALSGFEVVKSGTKMIFPKYIPLLSEFLNKFISNIWPFSMLGLFHYAVLRKPPKANAVFQPSVSIIVAARNEAGTIAKIIKDLPTLGAFTELIFIEGGSTDNTLDVIKRQVFSYKGDKKLKYDVQDGKGKGDAVRKGFEMATGDILMIYDADMTVPADEIVKFYDAIVNGRGDFINGSRLVYPMEKKSMRFFNILGNKFFSFAFSTILGQPIKDTLCGTKVLWRKDYEDVKRNRAFFGDFDPFGDFDLLFGASKLNLKLIDLPVHYKERKYGETNISRWKHGWLLLKMTVFAARKIKFI